MKDWKDVYVFISSTFNDMHAERDYLVKKVFPKISEWCMERKLRLIDIDLRWGITSDESDSLNNRVVEICLDNINKCRPFFICLLGQRRGWVPAKDDIAASTFEKIPEINNYAGNYSVTELEIIHALINPLAMRDENTDTVKKPEKVRNAFFLFRDFSYLEALKKDNPDLLNIYTNKLSRFPKEDDKSLEAFKKLITEGNSEDLNGKWYSYIDYECDFDINQQTLELKRENSDDSLSNGRLVNFRLKDNKKELSDYVFDVVTSAIANEYPDRKNIIEDKEISEKKQQEEFYDRNLVPVIGRSDTLLQLLNYTEDGSNLPLLLYAEAGTGKTTLMANFIQTLKENNKRVCYRFAGISINSMQTDTLLKGIIKELYENDLIDVEMAEDSIEMTINELLEQKSSVRFNFRKIMKHINHELTIIIDAVNELNEDLDDIIWIPDELSKGAKFIISCKVIDDMNMFNRFKNRFNNKIELKNFESIEIRKLMIEQFLSTYLKKISDEEKNQLLEIEATKNPLFLKVLLSELRIYGSFENLKKEIPDFGQTTIKAFDKVLRRLENDTEYKKYTVPQRTIAQIVFGTLAYVRADISVDDLVNIILLREELNNDAAEEIKESVHGIIRQMRDYLIYHGNKLRYFYDSLRIASAEKYIADKTMIHSLLAEIYTNKIFEDDDNFSQKKEAYTECTYHLHKAEKHAQLKKLILNYKFIYNKISICGIEEVLNDLKYLNGDYVAFILRQVLDESKNNISKSPMALPTYLWLALENSENEDIKKLLNDAEQMTEYFWVKPFGVNNSVISENKSVNVINIDYPKNSDYDEDDGNWYDWYVDNSILYILKNISEDITFLEIWNTKQNVYLKDKIQLSENLCIHYRGVFVVVDKYIYYHQNLHKIDNVFKIDITTGKTDLFKKRWNIKEKPYTDILGLINYPKNISYLNIVPKDISEPEEAYLISAKNDSEVIICDINSDTVERICFNDSDVIDDVSCYGNAVIVTFKCAESCKLTIFIYTLNTNLVMKYEGVDKFFHSGKNLGIIIDSKYHLWNLDSMELICTVNIPVRYDGFEKALEGMYTPYKKIDFFENSAAIYSKNNIYIVDMKDKSKIHLNDFLRNYYTNNVLRKIKVCSHIAYVLVEYKYGNRDLEQCDIWNLKTFELISSTDDNRFIYSLFEADFSIKNYKNVQLISESDIVGGGYFVVTDTCYIIGRINKDIYEKRLSIWDDKKAIENSPGQIEISSIVDIDLSKSPGGYYDWEFKQCDDIIYIVNSIGNYIKVWGRDMQGEEIYSPIILNIEECFTDNDLFVLKTRDNKFLLINLKKNFDKVTESWVANNYVKKGTMRIADDEWNNDNFEQSKFLSGGFGFPNLNSYRLKIHEANYEILINDTITIKSIDENQNTNETVLEFKHNLTFTNRMTTYKRVNDELFIDMDEGFININLVTLKHKIILFSDILNINAVKITGLYYHNSKAIILTKEKIYIVNLEKTNCEMEINNTINDKRHMKMSSMNDDTVCFVFIDNIYFLNLSKGELINKRVMFPKDLLKIWPLSSYFDGEAYIYIYVNCVYVWSVKSDKVLMRKPLENQLKDERSSIFSNIRINDNYIDFLFDSTKISVDYINSIVVEQGYIEYYEKRYQIIRTFKNIRNSSPSNNNKKGSTTVNVWLFDKVIFIQDSKNKNVLCEGEHGLKIGHTNKEYIEVVQCNGKLYVLLNNNIIICDLKDGSIKTSSCNINPKYLKKLAEGNTFFYKEEGSIKISEECIIYNNSLTENISVIPLNNKYALINDGYIYVNKEGKPIRLLPLNTNW